MTPGREHPEPEPLKESPMATVIIYRTDGSTQTITGVDPDDTSYDDLPFTDPNVTRTEIQL